MKQLHVIVTAFTAATIWFSGGAAIGQWKHHGLDGFQVFKQRMLGNALYAGTDDGIYWKDISDEQAEWTSIGPDNKTIASFVVITRDTILAGVRITGLAPDTLALFRTVNGGETWEPFQNGFGRGEGSNTAFALESMPDNPNTIIGAGFGFLARSTDAGQAWEIYQGNWDIFSQGMWFVAFDPVTPEVVWSGGRNAAFQPFLIKTENDGADWDWILGGGRFNLDGENTSFTLDVSQAAPEQAFVGMQGLIQRTLDGGETWEIVLDMGNPSFEPDARNLFGLGVSRVRTGHIYAAGSKALSPEFPQELALLRSVDNGETWMEFREPSTEFGGVLDLLVVNTVVERIFLGTLGSGVYEFDPEQIPSTVTDAFTPAPELDLEIFPNPVNANLALVASTDRLAIAELNAYDAMGRKFFSITLGALPPGRRMLHWNIPGDLANGTYILELRTARASVQTRMVVAR